MKTLKYFITITAITMFSACAGADRNGAPNTDNSKKEKESGGFTIAPHDEQETGPGNVLLDSTSSIDPWANKNPGPNFMSSSASIINRKDSLHKFIRTADIKFKVKQVIAATYRIEEIVRRHGGYVSYTNLQSLINYVTTTPVSADSSLEATWFTIVNNMVLRVPDEHLDTTLKDLAPLVGFLDFRTIKAADVSLQLLANQLSQKRLKKYNERMTDAIDDKGKKLRETTDGEENLLSRQEQQDNALIAALTMQDQIEMSTINLNIYQRSTLKRELIPNDKNMEAYEPGLGSRIAEGLHTGWRGIEAILIFFARIWGLIAVIVITFIVYRRYLKGFMKRK
jgi:hypothetical protein